MGAEKSNITVVVESNLLKKARSLAACRGRSVSALPAEKLHELVAKDIAYESARLKALGFLKSGFSLEGIQMVNRGEAHD